jgi:hypothetical protein
MKLRLRSSLGILFLAAAALVFPAFLEAGGAAEESESSRGVYVAAQGQIIPPAEIDIGSYISSVDYGYPDPPGEFGVTLYSGHRQASLSGQEEIIQIGIQGERTPFEDLPVLNLAFVFDSSGSMSEKDKIEWAKESFALLLRRLRPQDILAVVAFAEEARLLLPATRVGEITDRKALLARVQEVIASGRSNLEMGLAAGYEQVRDGYRPDQVNRIVFISDGLGSPEKAAEIVGAFRRQGVSLSTITVGMNCDLNTMNQLSKRGAGSSRFISNREKMEEIFGSGLDRMVVPIAYDLVIRLQLAQGTELLGTWGYDYQVEANTIRYSLPALHHRDYETMLAQVRLPAKRVARRQTIAHVELSYTDRAGVGHITGPYPLTVDYTDSSIAAGGIADPTVLKAGTMLHTAQGLEAIGFLYYSNQEHSRRLYRINRTSKHNTDVPQDERLAAAIAREQAENNQSIRANQQRCLDLAEAIKKEIHNTHLRLGEDCFAEELTIVRKYIEILGGELHLPEAVVTRLLADEEIHVEGIGSGRRKQLQDLINELTIVLEGQPGVSVAFVGFNTAGGEETPLQRTAEHLARSRLQELPRLRLVSDAAVEQVLARLEISRQSLLDNDIAFKAGAALNSDYLLVGRIMEMPTSIVVFGKLLNRRSGAVESVAQTILAQEE